jgi:hypothetical protein
MRTSTRCKSDLPRGRTRWASSIKLFMMLFLLGSFSSTKLIAQTCPLASNPDQAVNGGVGQTVVSPVEWVNGNVNSSKAHYKEGQSIPYRVEITGLTPGVPATFTFCYDITKSTKHAIDFVTSPNRITETVDPTIGLTGYTSGGYTTYPIPILSTESVPSGTPTSYYNETATYMQQLSASELQMWIYNGTITNLAYSSVGNENGTDQTTCMTVYFTPSSDKVLLSWGGHIATENNWGSGQGATGVSGSPYHTSMAQLTQGTCIKTIGSQDLQLQAAAICNPPSLTGPDAATVCAGTNATFTVTTAANTTTTGLTFTWTVDAVAVPAASVVTSGLTSTLTVNTTGMTGSHTIAVTVANQCGNNQTATTTLQVNVGPQITCPTSTTVASCQTQAAVNAAFTAWLATASASGGTLTNNGGTAGPDACGGAKTVTFTASNSCGTQTCSAVFTVTNSPAVQLTCPTSTTVAAGQTQAAVDAAFQAWLATASASGGCNGALSNNGGTSGPLACGGAKTVTFTYTNSCAATPSTCSATFTVTGPAAVQLTCPTSTTVASCQTQAAVNTAYLAWLGTASASGGTNGGLSNNGGTTGPDACGGAKTVTFTYTNSCSAPQTCSAVFTVSNPPAVQLTCPTSTTIAGGQTQAQVDAAFVAWLATARASGGCAGALSNNGGTAGPEACGGSKTVTFTYTNSCSTAQTCSATFTVPLGCLTVYCTYTQGFYGNNVGKACDGSPAPNLFSTTETITNSINAQGGITIGGALRSVTVTSSTADVQAILDLLPGSGKSRAFDHTGAISITALPTSYLSNQGTINNQLFSQTLTLSLNMGVKPGLGTFGLQANQWLVTAAVVECGSTVIKDCHYTSGIIDYSPYASFGTISTALYTALPTKDVAGLLALANSALNGTALPTGVSYSDITNAVDMINNAFDGCRSFVSWLSTTTYPTQPSSLTLGGIYCTAPTTTTSRTTGENGSVMANANNMSVTAYPNPYTDIVKFTIQSKVSGQAELIIYNTLGQRVKTIYNGYIQANRNQVVEYKASSPTLGNLIYVLNVGGKQVTGKLLKLNQ